MNHTPNYQLNQWEASDRVQRTDFNADNVRIEAALGTKSEVVFGTYVGDGAENRGINLGRKPKAVYLCTETGLTVAGIFGVGGLALPGAPVKHDLKDVFELTDTGFTVHFIYASGNTGIASNLPDMKFHYIAFF